VNGSVLAFAEQHLDKLTGQVLEVGSRNINGSVRELVPHAIGTDMMPGRNVDIVCRAEDLLEHFGPEKFDAVMSFDAFEHIEDWRACVTNMWGVLKPGGWLVMTMASLGKGRHAYPDDYWRADWELLNAIFPDIVDMEELGGASMGWTVQKERELPDLSKIDLIPVP
jgi:predicted SAM-dependent methyltransferase